MDNILNATWLNTQSYVAAAFLVLPFLFLLHRSRQPNLPVANPRKLFELSVAKNEFVHNARQIIDKCLEKSNGNNFQVNSDSGPLIVLTPKFIQEIRNDPRLSFARFIGQVWLKHLSFPPTMRNTDGGVLTSIPCPATPALKSSPRVLKIRVSKKK
jgi:hypothetical protein